jgi:hypothetical protein
MVLLLVFSYGYFLSRKLFADVSRYLSHGMYPGILRMDACTALWWNPTCIIGKKVVRGNQMAMPLGRRNDCMNAVLSSSRCGKIAMHPQNLRIRPLVIFSEFIQHRLVFKTAVVSVFWLWKFRPLRLFLDLAWFHSSFGASAA